MNIEASIERFLIDEMLQGSARTEIASDESLISSGILDSLGVLRLISFIQDRFNVTVEDVEVIPDNFETIAAVKALVASKL